eukprot:TRINITY_DN10938_c0_g1_i1.p1 TRINITY_DN10938_c0_g1~~TRINITY_DN10938_c0_g1_i1.p1  ORF type:complete len:420 (-),score=131.46 TRINITY_DN10938_c0_g1_i1:452-1711(-)
MLPTQMYPSDMPPVNSFWQGVELKQNLKSLQEHIDFLKTLTKELEVIAENNQVGKSVNLEISVQERGPAEVVGQTEVHETLDTIGKPTFRDLAELIKSKNIKSDVHESITLEAAIASQTVINNMLIPFDSLINQTCPWEERSVAFQSAEKRLKAKRNRKWRKKKRKLLSESLKKEHEKYEQVDREADEWRAREIAKDIARRKVEKMKEIAKIKAKEEKRRLEEELELVLIVERLQELRDIRIQKLKKQGHFLPEEDDKFLERVRAAVEEEERQAAAAADTNAAANAIASAQGSQKGIATNVMGSSKEDPSASNRNKGNEAVAGGHDLRSDKADSAQGHEKNPQHEDTGSVSNDMIDGLPLEFYHYYYGSNADMGTLIEVRRNWDAFLMPGGSRIPGHWVHPPEPANEIWASYLARKDKE